MCTPLTVVLTAGLRYVFISMNKQQLCSLLDSESPFGLLDLTGYEPWALTAVAQPHFCISATFGYWRAGVVFEGVLAVLDWTCGVFLVSPSLSAPLCAVSIVPEPYFLL